MKLFRFDEGRIGVQLGHDSYDITDTLGLDVAMWPPVQMVQVIRRFSESVPALLDHPKTRRIDLASVRLQVPIAWPNKLLALPVNYVAHGAEMKSVNRADLNGFFLCDQPVTVLFGHHHIFSFIVVLETVCGNG